MFFKKKKEDGTIKKVYGLTHIEGIPDMQKNGIAQIFLYPDRIAINNIRIIAVDRIKKTSIYSEKEILEQSKSVIGRAAVGGLLLGPLGAIVGGMSGTGTKGKNKANHFLSIEFVGIDGTDHMGIFSCSNSVFAVCDLVKRINVMVGVDQAGPREV